MVYVGKQKLHWSVIQANQAKEPYQALQGHFIPQDIYYT